MDRSFVVSRRKAALFLAGSFATSLGSAAAADAVGPAPASASDASIRLVHRRIAELMQRVRRANGPTARGRAFARCAAAIQALGTSEVASLSASAVRSGRANALYRPADTTLVLAAVIVRELQTWPLHDDAWLTRFSDLEAALATHFNDHVTSGAVT